MIKNTVLFVALFILFQPILLPAQVVPSPPTGEASSYVLLDYHSNHVIAEKNPAKEVEPASLTKMMTIYVAGEELRQGHINLDDNVLVSEKAWRMPGSRMFIEVDTKVTVQDLLKGIIIQSGNDASVALAEHVSGSEDVFVQLMNQAADKLGMENTHFENSTGMPAPGHVTTAQDMAILARALIHDHPELYGMHAIKEFTYNGITQSNRNLLLWRDESVDGIKTGHTESAGYCLVTSAKREGMRLISVVMGSQSESSRASFSQSLLEYGFRFFETARIAEGGQKIDTARVWKGASNSLQYGVSKDLYVTIPRGELEKLQQQINLNSPLVAPIKSQQPIGTISLLLNKQTLVKQPIIALDDVEQAGILGRLIDGARIMLEL